MPSAPKESTAADMPGLARGGSDRGSSSSDDISGTVGQAEGAAAVAALVPAAVADGAVAPGGPELTVTRSRPSWALAELAAPPPDADEVAARRAALAARRADAERFHFKQLWTKDPHGGPYRKVVPGSSSSSSSSGGIVSSGAGSSTRHKQLAVAGASGGGYRGGGGSGPGYEAVRVGPTTNFVGDAMCTAAVDLVLAELEELQAPPPLPPALPPATGSASTCLLPLPPPHPPAAAPPGTLAPPGAATGDAVAAGAPREAAALEATWAALAARRGANAEPSAAGMAELRRAARRLLGRR
ncbi:hypothetical protein HYH02_008323 [Chlamydomonas schloesseri]|uniref:Uncharacterized protein n=1 Tax=Chlamydomonas schloesseri TaxID=2026947 RepID=A0A835WG11_9CHLO|nr:hypothetical protein HYH02_008323 [Chlamydomonas schloesseri]|eukprot:KAG2446762.1 hypothetical protein HYH02_008323 [Chlamydomonas schloesseri]